MATRALGFTIIETMLFLGLTGLMLAGLLVGVNSSINVQRYNDASQTLKNFLQDQYSATINVQNSREDNQWRCTTAGGVISDTTGGDLRGQSRCVLLGRYITINDTTIRSYTVTAYKRASDDSLNDIQSLRSNYALNLAKTNTETTSLEWGTRIAWTKSGPGAQTPTVPRSMSLLIIRSPDSGQMYTFTSNSTASKATIDGMDPTVAPSFLRNMVVSGTGIPGQGSRIVCIEPAGLGIGHRLALRIANYASSSSAISLTSNETMRTESGRPQC